MRLAAAALFLLAACAADVTVLVVSPVPEGAAALEAALALDGREAQAALQVSLAEAPLWGKQEVRVAVALPPAATGELGVGVRILDGAGCILALGSTTLPEARVRVVPVTLDALPPGPGAQDGPGCPGARLPAITSVNPSFVSNGYPLAVRGWGFQPGAQVWVRDRDLRHAATEVRWASRAEITARAPVLADLGKLEQRAVTLLLINPDGTEGAAPLTYFNCEGEVTRCPDLKSETGGGGFRNLQCDPNHCGACDRSCLAERKADRCLEGQCRCGDAPPCGAGTVCVGGRCVPCDQQAYCGPSCAGCGTKRCGGGGAGVAALRCVECRDNKDCPAGKYCDGQFTCQPCTVNNACGASCQPCAAPTPFCLASTAPQCVQCLSAATCGAGSLCDNQGRCRLCTLDHACGPSCQACGGQTPVCGGDRCVQCTRDGNCAADQICDTTTNTCIGNRDDCCGAACTRCAAPSPFCRRGVCIQCRNNNDCTAPKIYCNGMSCVMCFVDLHCPVATPYCVGQGCVSCKDSTHCGGRPCVGNKCT